MIDGAKHQSKLVKGLEYAATGLLCYHWKYQSTRNGNTTLPVATLSMEHSVTKTV